MGKKCNAQICPIHKRKHHSRQQKDRCRNGLIRQAKQQQKQRLSISKSMAGVNVNQQLKSEMDIEEQFEEDREIDQEQQVIQLKQQQVERIKQQLDSNPKLIPVRYLKQKQQEGPSHRLKWAMSLVKKSKRQIPISIRDAKRQYDKNMSDAYKDRQAMKNTSHKLQWVQMMWSRSRKTKTKQLNISEEQAEEIYNQIACIHQGQIQNQQQYKQKCIDYLKKCTRVQDKQYFAQLYDRIMSDNMKIPYDQCIEQAQSQFQQDLKIQQLAEQNFKLKAVFNRQRTKVLKLKQFPQVLKNKLIKQIQQQINQQVGNEDQINTLKKWVEFVKDSTKMTPKLRRYMLNRIDEKKQRYSDIGFQKMKRKRIQVINSLKDQQQAIQMAQWIKSRQNDPDYIEEIRQQQQQLLLKQKRKKNLCLPQPQQIHPNFWSSNVFVKANQQRLTKYRYQAINMLKKLMTNQFVLKKVKQFKLQQLIWQLQKSSLQQLKSLEPRVKVVLDHCWTLYHMRPYQVQQQNSNSWYGQKSNIRDRHTDICVYLFTRRNLIDYPDRFYQLSPHIDYCSDDYVQLFCFQYRYYDNVKFCTTQGQSPDCRKGIQISNIQGYFNDIKENRIKDIFGLKFGQKNPENRLQFKQIEGQRFMFGNIVKTHIGPILDLEYALWTRFKSLTYDLKNAFLALGDDGSYLCKALQMRIQWDKKPQQCYLLCQKMFVNGYPTYKRQIEKQRKESFADVMVNIRAILKNNGYLQSQQIPLTFILTLEQATLYYQDLTSKQGLQQRKQRKQQQQKKLRTAIGLMKNQFTYQLSLAGLQFDQYTFKDFLLHCADGQYVELVKKHNDMKSLLQSVKDRKFIEQLLNQSFQKRLEISQKKDFYQVKPAKNNFQTEIEAKLQLDYLNWKEKREKQIQERGKIQGGKIRKKNQQYDRLYNQLYDSDSSQQLNSKQLIKDRKDRKEKRREEKRRKKLLQQQQEEERRAKQYQQKKKQQEAKRKQLQQINLLCLKKYEEDAGKISSNFPAIKFFNFNWSQIKFGQRVVEQFPSIALSSQKQKRYFILEVNKFLSQKKLDWKNFTWDNVYCKKFKYLKECNPHLQKMAILNQKDNLLLKGIRLLKYVPPITYIYRQSFGSGFNASRHIQKYEPIAPFTGYVDFLKNNESNGDIFNRVDYCNSKSKDTKMHFTVGTSHNIWSLGPMFNGSISEQKANMSLIRFLTQRGYEYWLIAKKDIQRGDHLMWFYGKHYEHGFKLSDIQDLLDRQNENYVDLSTVIEPKQKKQLLKYGKQRAKEQQQKENSKKKSKQQQSKKRGMFGLEWWKF